LFWYAEHKTRFQDWRGARILLDQAQQAFQASQWDSEFISDDFPERHKLVTISIKENILIDEVVHRNEMERLDRLRREGEQYSSADSPMSTLSDWVYPRQIVDLEHSMFERSMFSVSPFPLGMGEEERRRRQAPPLSHSPVAGASPMQPGTPINEPNNGWALPPMDAPGEKAPEQQRATGGETTNEPVVYSPSSSPSGNNSLMELFPELQE